ncbi:nucleoside diphosphate kinase regulator [Roseicella aquatilis]|nr:nucleoside diphosphate kinase regulator [Roseicella aquatilis]
MTIPRHRLRRPASLIPSGIAAAVPGGPDPDAVPLLPARDYSRLKALLRRLRDPADPTAQVLADKLGRCRVVPPGDLPSWVAALGTRIVFAVEGGAILSRTLAMPEDDPQDGTALAVSTPVGAALLGTAARDLVEAVGQDGRRAALRLLAVHHGPGRWPATAMPPDRRAGSAALRSRERHSDGPPRGRDMTRVRRMSMQAGTETAALRPPLLMSMGDHDRLVALAEVAARRSPLVARLLQEETDRAEVVPAGGQVPAGVVALGSVAEFRDAATGETRRVQLVLPGEADIAEGRISVLSLVGAGLVGLSEGQSIDWPTQDGRLRRLTVLRVGAPPPA